MIIFLYGPDSYRRGQKLQEIVQVYKTRNGAKDFLAIDLGSEAEAWTKARDFLKQPSMFASVKVLLLKEADAAEEKEWSAVLRAAVDEEQTFVLVSNENQPKKKFSFLAEKPVRFQFFDELSGEALRKFLYGETEKRNLVFSPQAFSVFFEEIQRQRGRSWFAVNELTKLELADFPQPISLANLSSSLRLTSVEPVYSRLRRFLEETSRGRRLFWLESALLVKEEPAYLFNSLAYQVQGKKTSLLSQKDLLVKSGGLEYEEALLDFALVF